MADTTVAANVPAAGKAPANGTDAAKPAKAPRTGSQVGIHLTDEETKEFSAARDKLMAGFAGAGVSLDVGLGAFIKAWALAKVRGK